MLNRRKNDEEEMQYSAKSHFFQRRIAFEDGTTLPGVLLLIIGSIFYWPAIR
jgi:hypothetical protein